MIVSLTAFHFGAGSAINFGIEFVPREPYWRTVYYSIQSENSGFDYVWVTDHFNNRSCLLSLSLIGAYTSRIKLGPGVTNPYLSHPVMTAQAVASLSEIAPGRVVCGIGVGDKTTLHTVNVPQSKPLAAVEETVQIIRAMNLGRMVEHRGQIYTVTGAKFLFNPRGSVPVYIGAQGPKMLRLGGRLGDGVLINASHPRDVEDAVRQVKDGCAEVGRDVATVDIAAYTSFSLSTDEKKASKAALPVVAYIVAGASQSLLDAHQIPIEAAEKIRTGIVKEMWKDAFSNVTPAMIEAFSICGPPEACVERIERLGKLGLTQFVIGSPIGPSIRRSIELFSTEVLPHFKH